MTKRPNENGNGQPRAVTRLPKARRAARPLAHRLDLFERRRLIDDWPPRSMAPATVDLVGAASLPALPAHLATGHRFVTRYGLNSRELDW